MSGERSSDTSGDVSDEGQWLTYTELAKHRGIDRGSAVRLAIRRQWRRQKGNAGREVRVLVPPDMLTSDKSVESPAASEVTSTDTTGVLAAYVATFTDALTTLREQLAGAEARAAAAEQGRASARVRRSVVVGRETAEARADEWHRAARGAGTGTA